MWCYSACCHIYMCDIIVPAVTYVWRYSACCYIGVMLQCLLFHRCDVTMTNICFCLTGWDWCASLCDGLTHETSAGRGWGFDQKSCGTAGYGIWSLVMFCCSSLMALRACVCVCMLACIHLCFLCVYMMFLGVLFLIHIHTCIHENMQCYKYV